MLTLVLLTFSASTHMTSFQASHKPLAQGLRIEHLSNPQGVNEPRPRLSWFMASEERDDRQTSFQVLVASSPYELAASKGDLWDSGRVLSSDYSTQYRGRPVKSGQRCYWKVRVWNAAGRVGPWSEPAFWGAGLLTKAEWKAQWISSPILADASNRPRTPIHCYRSEISHDPNSVKWIALDLGASHVIDSVDLAPARPAGLTYDIATVQFPRRFRIEVANDAEFKAVTSVVDHTESDLPQQRGNTCRFSFAPRHARFIRLVVTKLGEWDAHDYGVFLGRFAVYSGAQSVSDAATVTASDSIENDQWSKSYLVGEPHPVEFSSFPPALDPHMQGAATSSRTVLLRRSFYLPGQVKRATLFSTARGFYEPRINGKRVSADLLAPGFTDYHKRISYQTYDVTSLLRRGPNTLAALLGYGWYAGHMNLAGNDYFYGFFPQFAAQLEVELVDGRRMTVRSDKHWTTSLEGPVRWSDLLDGEACDFRRDQPGWDRPGFDARTWQPAWTQDLGAEQLVAQQAPPVREIRLMKPVSRKETRPGVWVYDLGQEITGWVRLRVTGESGTHLVLRHAEAVKPDGSLDDASLWGTLQRDEYILDGKGPRVLEPHFTYHGFRYFELSGLGSPPDHEAIVAVNIHTDLEEVGSFECSNPLFNRLMEASKWTQRNLLFDVPAGCAARSERLAWTGDIRPCVTTALMNFDSTAFFEKYAQDLRDDQKMDGRFTDICPHAHLTGTEICVGSPGWADAGVTLPWDVYVNSGDRHLLEEHFESAKRWVDFVHTKNPDLLWNNARGMDWGDWLSGGQATPKEIGATAFFAHSTDLVSQMATALGRDKDAATYAALFKRIKAAFVAAYVSADGTIQMLHAQKDVDVTSRVVGLVGEGGLHFIVNNDSLGEDPAPNVIKSLKLSYKVGGTLKNGEYTEGRAVNIAKAENDLHILKATYGAASGIGDAQGSYALALRFGLLDEPLESKALGKLLQAIHRDGDHPSTGFWSTIEMVQALSDLGHHDVAEQLVNLKTGPSWGHMLEAGGTTFWEAFDADKKTLSLNHWTHSSCGEWLWQQVAGLSPDPQGPGYRRFTVRPRPTPSATWCKASYRSVRGPIKVDWAMNKDGFHLDLRVPPGSIATVYLPLPEGSQGHVTGVGGLKLLSKSRSSWAYEAPTGSYMFTTR